MTYIWCHGPRCHTKSTQDRVPGTKGSKVLRTRKVKQHTNSTWYNPNSWYNWFCSMGCYNDFANKNAQRIIALDPRTEPLETRIEDPKKVKYEYSYGSYTRTEINKLDESSNVG